MYVEKFSNLPLKYDLAVNRLNEKKKKKIAAERNGDAKCTRHAQQLPKKIGNRKSWT